ncbi:MAG: bifunctional isocitrate dehydrogenase kinase/phosphatase [Gammaproteobacteria bacterium]|nr:bifunctional isocitrate dehydrogenase kinase/phosphatase [Gammaproteobacteria bacterium]MDH3448555.1 bifunctional isocitrate dehydrogenase kinase/phosphatase [Gammaproteobacteria bacterium]
MDTPVKGLSIQIAASILNGFNRHFMIFSKITKGAKERFESADWHAEREASRERIKFYDIRVKDAIRDLQKLFDLEPFNSQLWFDVKREYVQLISDHLQPELAETFYNSVFCALFHRDYFGNDYIFVRSAVSTEFIDSEKPSYHVYYPARRGFRASIKQVLLDASIDLPFEDIGRDVRHITKALIKRTFPRPRRAHLNFQFQVISAVFYRNKAAYIVGRAINSNKAVPFAIPILHSGEGTIYCDAIIIGKQGLNRLFEFSYVYFMVDHPVPSSIVTFLRRLMPTRSKESFYSAIGFHKQGKTVFYRDFLHHLKHSEDELIFAPGIKGMVMAVFTLPSYPYVFKVIRDRFPPPKKTTRQEVLETYRLVKMHDRVGRMSDILEYSHVALPRNRFAADLLEELYETCANSISEEGDQVVIKHLYIERRMTPLNIAVQQADDYYLDRLMKGYGEAIKELAGANIFPGDLLLKNFGVTGQGQGRVVFYDYDEICYLTECKFRRIPEPLYPEDEFASEPWYSVAANDVFPEQFVTFLFADNRVRQAFLKYHRDLLDADFWTGKQENIRAGIYEDVFPYPQKIRFER